MESDIKRLPCYDKTSKVIFAEAESTNNVKIYKQSANGCGGPWKTVHKKAYTAACTAPGVDMSTINTVRFNQNLVSAYDM